VLSNVKKLVLGNGTAQALQLISLLILSRLYRPDDFGLLAAVQSIATLACVVGTLQLHLTIPLAATSEIARSTAESVQTLCAAFFLVSLPFALFLGNVAASSLVLALCLGLSNTYTSYLVYQGSFSQLSRFYIARAAAIVALQLVFAMLDVDSGLLWGFVLAEAIAAFSLRMAYLGPLLRKPDLRKAFALAASFRSFSVYGTMQELVSVSAFYAPLLLFTSTFGESTGGQFSMASRLVWAPVVLLSGSLAQVLYHRWGQLLPTTPGSIYRPLFSPMVVIGAFVVCALAFACQDMFLLALGEQWGLASRLMPLQVLWGMVFLLSTPFRVVVRVMHLQKHLLAIDLAMLASIMLLFALTDVAPLTAMWFLVMLAVCQSGLIAASVSFALRRRAVALPG